MEASPTASGLRHHTKIAINSFFHILLLFSALLVLFLFVIAPKEKKVLETQLTHAIDNHVPQFLADADARSGGTLKPALANADQELEVLQVAYSEEDEATRNFNWILIVGALGFLVTLIGIILAMVLTLKVAARVSMGRFMAAVVTENVILFAFIGLVEYLFFVHVSSKYVPILPYEIAKVIQEDFKKILS